jgi:hypothetical protein
MSTDQDPLWKRIWRTEGIRWLGPRGDGSIDAMERFQHGFELGRASVLQDSEWQQVAKDLAEAGTAVWGAMRRAEKPPKMVVGLFLEAARAYDQLLELQHEEGR